MAHRRSIGGRYSGLALTDIPESSLLLFLVVWREDCQPHLLSYDQPEGQCWNSHGKKEMICFLFVVPTLFVGSSVQGTINTNAISSYCFLLIWSHGIKLAVKWKSASKQTRGGQEITPSLCVKQPVSPDCSWQSHVISFFLHPEERSLGYFHPAAPDFFLPPPLAITIPRPVELRRPLFMFLFVIAGHCAVSSYSRRDSFAAECGWPCQLLPFLLASLAVHSKTCPCIKNDSKTEILVLVLGSQHPNCFLQIPAAAAVPSPVPGFRHQH